MTEGLLLFHSKSIQVQGDDKNSYEIWFFFSLKSLKNKEGCRVRIFNIGIRICKKIL